MCRIFDNNRVTSDELTAHNEKISMILMHLQNDKAKNDIEKLANRNFIDVVMVIPKMNYAVLMFIERIMLNEHVPLFHIFRANSYASTRDILDTFNLRLQKTERNMFHELTSQRNQLEKVISLVRTLIHSKAFVISEDARAEMEKNKRIAIENVVHSLQNRFQTELEQHRKHIEVSGIL
ncbi:hypothetical protein Ciccas_011608 [Cichlidogyrus casuarinus]|uniref:Uncharacterized protein n=1 Tax=Cichlidogyrus casuarinus TaxID=1844966 RepID=A0ABD2PRY6_9PLAT